MNIFILAKNYEHSSGYYHQDIINAFKKNANCFLYGDGYPNYCINDSINDVIAKSHFEKDNIDLIVVSTSWEIENESIGDSDPHPKITLSTIKNIPKIFFLNKEYKKLAKKFEYIKKNKFDYVITVHPNFKKWEKEINTKFINIPFGISLERFKDFGLRKKYDFAFTGALHRNHIDMRYNIKKLIFKDEYLSLKSNRGWDIFPMKNPIKIKYQKYNVYWAEWGSKDLLGRSLLPHGKQYAKFLNSVKIFLNTPSAVGIMNTRFFELMATKTLILCPESNYYFGILKNGQNCIMFKPDLSNFDEILIEYLENNEKRKKIVDYAFTNIKEHSYDGRISRLLKIVKK